MDRSSKQNEIERLQEVNLQLKMDNNNLRSKSVRYMHMKAPRCAVGNASNSDTNETEYSVSMVHTLADVYCELCARTVIGECKAGLHLNVIEGFHYSVYYIHTCI